MDNLLSIIVPIYNIVDYLEECIDSILAQTYTNIEIILVDDGSTDGSSQICDKYQLENDMISVIHQENKGVTCARNTGLSVAKGKLVAFIDGDDTIHKQMYEIMIEAMVRNNADFVFSIIKRIYGKQQDNIIVNQEILIEGKDIVKARFDMYAGVHIGKSVCDKVFRRECIKENTFLEGLQQGEDNLFMVRIIFECSRCVFVGKELYYYRDIREGNSNSRYTSERIFSAKLPVQKAIIQLLYQNRYDDIAKQEQRKMYSDFFEYYKEIIKNPIDTRNKKDMLQILDSIITEELPYIRNTYKYNRQDIKQRFKWVLYCRARFLLALWFAKRKANK